MLAKAVQKNKKARVRDLAWARTNLVQANIIRANLAQANIIRANLAQGNLGR
jgi:uncharacterized protein YjbI with pentapeptide repeats